jgi:hypothetical protein
MDKAPHVKFNAIQVVCSSSYFLSGYIAHKDACLPQIWPRKENLPKLVTSNRYNFFFFLVAIIQKHTYVLLDSRYINYAMNLKM